MLAWLARSGPGRNRSAVGLWDVLLLAGAAFAAGAINTVAGGGSLVSFPALLAAGYPAKPANVTNTVALWPGYLGGTLGYREEVLHQRTRAIALLLPCAAGAVAGSVILLGTPESTFETAVPFLILFACLLLALQPWLGGMAARLQMAGGGQRVPPVLVAAVFLLSVYGAYFGAGLGILLLAALGILLPDELQRSNALKGFLSMAINAVAVAWFAAFGPVEWTAAATMAVSALAGGYLGANVARALGARWLRVAVIGYGLIVVAVIWGR